VELTFPLEAMDVTESVLKWKQTPQDLRNKALYIAGSIIDLKITNHMKAD
jgi:hypothetical protein